MELAELFSRVALAFGVGLVIGLERGWHTREARPGSRAAGVRTFTISGLLGGVIAAAALDGGSSLSLTGSLLLAAGLLAYTAVITVFTRDQSLASGTYSATTAVAALLTFVLGASALLIDVRVTAAAAVATAGILMVREELHEWVSRITPAELRSGLVLLAMTFVALPVLPNRPIGPMGGVNPHEVWIVAIALATASFGGYVAVRLFGEQRGILLAAATGGLVSSTAVTLAYARRAAAGEGSPQLLAAGAGLATAMSLVRVAAIVAVLQSSLLRLVAPALILAAAVAAGLAAASVHWRSPRATCTSVVQLRNPLAFWSVLGIAASLALLILLGRWFYMHFGTTGAIAGAVVMGLFDVDAMTVSVTRLPPQSLDLPGASYAILAGVASNTISKATLGALIARNRFAAEIASISLACLAAGGLGLLAAASLG